MKREDMTAEYIKTKLHYDPETGIFTRISGSNRKKVGKLDKDGYLVIKIINTNCFAHRLAFLYMTGRFPTITDHINRIRTDNRWENLREVSVAENNANRSCSVDSRAAQDGKSKARSGFRYVYWHGRMNRWYVQIRHNGRYHHGGYHITAEQAARSAESLRCRLTSATCEVTP